MSRLAPQGLSYASLVADRNNVTVIERAPRARWGLHSIQRKAPLSARSKP